MFSLPRNWIFKGLTGTRVKDGKGVGAEVADDATGLGSKVDDLKGLETQLSVEDGFKVLSVRYEDTPRYWILNPLCHCILCETWQELLMLWYCKMRKFS